MLISLLQICVASRGKGKKTVKGNCKISQDTSEKQNSPHRWEKMLSQKLLTFFGMFNFWVKVILSPDLNVFNFFSPEVIDKYKIKIQGLEKDVKEILKQESEEKEVGV